MRCALSSYSLISNDTRSNGFSRVRPVKPSRPCFAARQSSCAVKASPAHGGPAAIDEAGSGNGGRGGSGDWFGRRWQPDGGGWSSPATIICLVLSCQAFKAEASPRRKGRKHNRSWADWDDNPELNGYATHLTDLAWPLLQNLGFSGAVGLVCAIAFKAVGRVVAIGLGTTFAVVQLLAYGGFITVEWSKIHEDILRMCDVDRDGNFGASDLHDVIGSSLAMLSQGLPSLSGFCLGFGFGLRF